MYSANVSDFIRPASATLVGHACTLLSRAGAAVTTANILRLIRSAPNAASDLTDSTIGQRSFCMQQLLKITEGKPQGFFDATAEKLADYFIDEFPSVAPESRRLLEEAVAGVLGGLNGGALGGIGAQQPAASPRRDRGNLPGQRKAG
jgi:hypothetical protein